jgi:hypothetical protein
MNPCLAYRIKYIIYNTDINHIYTFLEFADVANI